MILFVYLYQVNDWFGSSEYCCPCEQVDEFKGYLSCCVRYRLKIQNFLHEQTGIVLKLATILHEK